MRGLQITELKQLFGTDDAFIAYGFEKFHQDDLLLDLSGTHTRLIARRENTSQKSTIHLSIGLSRVTVRT